MDIKLFVFYAEITTDGCIQLILHGRKSDYYDDIQYKSSGAKQCR